MDGPIRGSPGGSGASRSCGAGKGVAALRSKASAALHCPLFFFCCATEVVGDPWLGGPLDVGRMMLGGTAGPANHLVQNKLRGEQPAALTRILLTAGEVREALRVRYVADELTASRLLRERVSRSASGFMKMGLTRHIIRDELSELAGSRMQRAALWYCLRDPVQVLRGRGFTSYHTYAMRGDGQPGAPPRMHGPPGAAADRRSGPDGGVSGGTGTGGKQDPYENTGAFSRANRGRGCTANGNSVSGLGGRSGGHQGGGRNLAGIAGRQWGRLGGGRRAVRRPSGFSGERAEALEDPRSSFEEGWTRARM